MIGFPWESFASDHGVSPQILRASPGSTWPRRPGRPPVAQCTALASWNSSTGRLSSGLATQRRWPQGLGPCRRGRTPRSVRCSRRRVAVNSPVSSHGCKLSPSVAERVAGKPGLFAGGRKFYFMYSSQGVEQGRQVELDAPVSCGMRFAPGCGLPSVRDNCLKMLSQ